MRAIVKDLYDFELFDLFFRSVIWHGGDGSSVIICKDPHEMSTRFLNWCDSKGHGWVNSLEKDITPNCVNFHDWNENFMFDTDLEKYNGDGWDYSNATIEVKGTLKTIDDKIIQED